MQLIKELFQGGGVYSTVLIVSSTDILNNLTKGSEDATSWKRKSSQEICLCCRPKRELPERRFSFIQGGAVLAGLDTRFIPVVARD